MTLEADLGPAPQPHEVRREGITMALYVAMCLLAALEAVDVDDDVQTLALVWGTTIGLALAHWFAFTMSSRYVHRGTFHKHDAEVLGAELIGAAVVAALCTAPVLLLPESAELHAIRLLLAALIAAVAFAASRASGASHARAAGYALIVLLVALLVVGVKAALVGH